MYGMITRFLKISTSVLKRSSLVTLLLGIIFMARSWFVLLSIALQTLP